MRRAAFEPTLPKPWITTRVWSRFLSSRLRASSHTVIRPRPVASRRPWEPPSPNGLPGTIADAALSGASINRVLHPEASERFQTSVVELNRDVDDDLAAGLAENLPQSVIELELLRGQIGASDLRLPRIHFFQICGWHHS